MVIEELRHDEVEQGPKLCHGVLDWSSRKQQPVSGLEVEQSFPTATVVVLDRLSFV